MLSTIKRSTAKIWAALAAVLPFAQAPIQHQYRNIDPQLKRMETHASNRLSQKKRRQRARWQQ